MIKDNAFNELKDLVSDILANLELTNPEKKAIKGITSGFDELDAYTNGFKGSDFIILASRPAMGKTSLSLDIAKHVAFKEGIPVLFFSLEHTGVQLAIRMIGSEARLNGSRIKTNNFDETEGNRIVEAACLLQNMPIIFEDTANIAVSEIKHKSKIAYVKYGIGLIIVDYLQLIACSKENNDKSYKENLDFILKSLKELASELKVPVICLSQLPRSIESRDDKRPKLSDLGKIEKYADLVLFLYRDAYYGINIKENSGRGEIIIAKQKKSKIKVETVQFLLRRFK